MSLDEVKQDERVRQVVDIESERRPDLQRDAQVVTPIVDRRLPALLRRARDRLDWSRIPRLPEPSTKPVNIGRSLLKQFGLFVLLPTAIIALYLFAIASDQYVAEARFAIRGNVEPMGDVALGEFTTLIKKHNSQDSFIVKDFIGSQNLVEQLEKSLSLSQLYSRPEADFWARYWGYSAIEYLTRYWNRQVAAHIDVISGVITLTVRAFTPQDALTISKAVLTRSEQLINDISQRAQADMLKQAEIETGKVQARLRKAYIGLQEFRNRWGIIDPVKSAEATATTLLSLRRDKLKAESDIQVLRGSNLDEKSRSIQTLAATITAIDQQIRQLQEQLTTDGLTAGASTNMTQALLEYEGLMVERTIAEKLNESANFILDKARVEASKQHVFLATFVEPSLPDASLYPRRPYTVIVAFFCFLVVWSSCALIIGGLKDQRL
ncbi:capsule biosynthesis protein [Methylobacterium sp. Leaf399]|uniref:hypothetical protein n=1 Tax=unclassified Methylobacterium TaxID=2615210 RepID=UPI0006F7547C|nr:MULTISPECIES: hypothetical protein [unclassified Methylobacterium]KQP51916.1 capsule biosynthesis protein [Methylobacterium sp. Leaf108]KQT14662.1 capsule biosynthesis protein [Methylobacterium sp. Leaf399]KQT90326.1 capsule biosynthesis protein [Methylobacterium sp. Leaf466]